MKPLIGELITEFLNCYFQPIFNFPAKQGAAMHG